MPVTNMFKRMKKRAYDAGQVAGAKQAAHEAQFLYTHSLADFRKDYVDQSIIYVADCDAKELAVGEVVSVYYEYSRVFHKPGSLFMDVRGNFLQNETNMVMYPLHNFPFFTYSEELLDHLLRMPVSLRKVLFNSLPNTKGLHLLRKPKELTLYTASEQQLFLRSRGLAVSNSHDAFTQGMHDAYAVANVELDKEGYPSVVYEE